MHTFCFSIRRRQLASALVLGGLAARLPAQAAATTNTPPPSASILVLGDSLSAEYGLRRGSGWVALLTQRLARMHAPWQVVNASISGDTTAGGRARLPALLQRHHPAVVVLELGANDALRGLPIGQTEAHLSAMVRMAQAAGARVLLVGMQVPPNYGPAYTRQFAQVFQAVSRQQKTGLVPFLLAGVADAPQPLQWFQADRLHPNERAQGRMEANVWPSLAPLLRAAPHSSHGVARR